MPQFKYEALDNNGKMNKGVAEGQDSDDVINQLTDQGLSPVSVLELDENGKEIGGLLGRLVIVGICFVIGLLFPLLRRSLRQELVDGGPMMLIGVPVASGVLFAMVAAMLALVQQIESPAKRAAALYAGIFTIVIIALAIFMFIEHVVLS